MEKWTGNKLLSVDIWKYAIAQRKMRRARKVLSRYGDRSEIIRDLSLSASKKIPDGSLDFVYIDADHGFCAVLTDILAWMPKVRAGGILSGHDYNASCSGPSYKDVAATEVRSAVDLTFGALGWTIYESSPEEEEFTSWFVWKRET